MRDPKDVLLVDLDDQGKWKILSKDEVDSVNNRLMHRDEFGNMC